MISVFLWCSEQGEALLCSGAVDLATGRVGLFKHHYLLLPSSNAGQRDGADGAPAALCALRLTALEELAPPAEDTGGEGTVQATPFAVVAAVQAQLGKLPLAPLDPGGLSSRLHETVEVSCDFGRVGPCCPTEKK